MLALNRKHLIAGLIATLIVGAGRWWDDPHANLLQHLGIGSFVYVFILSFVLWLVALPLRPRNWKYARVLTFVTLTAPPAILYAIPVERIMTIPQSINANMTLLAIVATWRVAMYSVFLFKTSELPPLRTAVALLLPLSTAIAYLHLRDMMYEVLESMMGSIHVQGAGAAPMVSAHVRRIAKPLGDFTMLAWPFILLGYVMLIFQAYWTNEKDAVGPDSDSDSDSDSAADPNSKPV